MTAHRVFIALGSNMGDRLQVLLQAMKRIRAMATDDFRFSGIYETEPVGIVRQNDFLNAVVEARLIQKPGDILQSLMNIEAELGRKRMQKWGPRTIDLDILAIDDMQIDEADLKVPHPEMPNRLFVLVPFHEIAADFYVLGFNKTVQELLQECQDNHSVKLYKTSYAVEKMLRRI